MKQFPTIASAVGGPLRVRAAGAGHRGAAAVAAARCDGRGTVGCIVLGRGDDATQLRHSLAIAAGISGFIDSAVGRTTFWDAVVGWQAQTTTRAEAVEQIAARFLEWVGVFETARLANATALAIATP